MKLTHTLSVTFLSAGIALGNPGSFGPESNPDLITLNSHFRAIAGASTADNIGDLATHNHDANDNFAIQGLEFSMSLNADFVQGYLGVTSFTTPDHEVESEWEEGFLKLSNEGFYGFELRGGRFFNRLGLQNNVHLHGWDFADANLSTAAFLGDEGLRTDGGEISWFKPFSSGIFGISAAGGYAVSHEEEEEEGDDEHGHSESAESAFFDSEVYTVRSFINWNHTDFHQHALGVNWAYGDNGFDRKSQLVSADYTYEWRENGFEPGGRAFRVGAEVYWRDVEWRREEEPDETGDSEQWGAMVFAGYDFDEHWSVDARYGWIEGVADGLEIHDGEEEYGFQIDERQRFSLALTHQQPWIERVASHVRLQYNYDMFDDRDDEHSVFLQVGFDFGGPEVR